MPKPDRKAVKKCVAWLRDRFPSLHPVRCIFVSPKSLGDAWATTSRNVSPTKKVSFTIRLSDGRSTEDVISDALHEWPHVLHMHLLDNQASHDHDAVYWAIHGQIYALWHEEKPGSE